MRKKVRQPAPPPTDIDITVGDRRFAGYYRIEKGAITVTLPGKGSKTAHLGGMTTQALARLLLAELAASKSQMD